jgi:ATP synthase protein I
MPDKQRPPSLEELGERLRKAQEIRTPPGQPPEPQSRQFGVAYRILVEMLAGVVVGGLLGWLLDHWLGTRPWLLMAMIVLGFAAGMSNVYRVTRQYAARAERESGSNNNAGSSGGR